MPRRSRCPVTVSSGRARPRQAKFGSGAATAVAVALLVTLVATPIAGAAGAPVLRKSGPSGEGPYPWAYPASGNIKAGTGKTNAGATCTAGTPQFDSPYAPPCVPKFTGNNGGDTSNGVTRTTITLAQREFPNAADTEEIEAEAKAAGAAIPQVISQVQQVFLNYFNSVYNLYGRKVVIKPYVTQASFTTEELGQGQAQACADADAIANQMHAFGESGITNGDSYGGTGPFSQCAAEDHLVEFNGNPYFDESSFEKLNPYVWNITQDCTRISSAEAEVVSTMMAGKKAIFAGSASLRSSTRKFAAFVPNVPQYLNCEKNFINLVEHKYHIAKSALSPSFNYNLDIATFQQSAQQAIIQFKAAGVTTIICSSDPFSLGLLTKAAAAQNYHPEWFMTGAALTDLDQTAQGLYDYAEIDGHMFGISESSPSTSTTGPASLAGRLYQRLTGHEIPKGTDGNYAELVEIFDALQAAGPDLTPANLARGFHALPTLGAPSYQYGSWSWNTGPTGTAGAGDHTGGEDARFVYWDGTKTSPLNGVKGTFVAAFGGKRFTLGHWPKSLPPLFGAS
jgi:Periplasmic binding protein